MSDDLMREELPAIRELASAEAGQIHCLAIVGEIEGHTLLPASAKTTKYEHVMPLLAAVEESPEIRGLLILLNTVGGDVEAGLAVAAEKSFIAPSAAMTLHPVRLTGVVIGVPQTYSYLAKVQDRIVRFITGHSRITGEALTELMLRTGELAGDVGSVIDGQEAVRLGLIDALGSLSDALGYLHRRMDGADP